MANSKKPTQSDVEAARTARVARAEAAIEKLKHQKGLMPSTPEEAAALDKRIEESERAQREFEKNYPGLKIPPKDGSGRGR